MARFRPAPRSAVLAAAALTLGLAACSSAAAPSTTTVTTAVPTVTTAASTPTAAAGSVAPPVLGSLADLADYYRRLGVADDVVACYVASLKELGVTDVNQLEANQALGFQAADRFDQCIARNGPLSTLH